ncbi:MAG: ABC transporter ATP-binding protein [Bacteroidales bacterium]
MLNVENISAQTDSFRLKNITFSMDKGDYLVLAGPSGAGKTMLLDTLAGHRKAKSGTILLNNRNIISLPADKRPFTLLFQELALFPHLNVAENIGYAIKDKNKPSIVKELAGQFFISHHLTKKPEQLSGGEKQRVALARALATKPDVLLLDEPLTSLDKPVKNELIRILFRLNQQGQTIIHVTHDVHEAINLADKTGILQNGKLTHLCTPQELMQKPKDYFTASFLDYENIIPLEGLEIPEKYNPSDYSYIAFDAQDIEYGEEKEKLHITGKLLQRPSGQVWLESPSGLIKIKSKIHFDQQSARQTTISIDYKNILFLTS